MLAANYIEFRQGHNKNYDYIDQSKYNHGYIYILSQSKKECNATLALSEKSNDFIFYQIYIKITNIYVSK